MPGHPLADTGTPAKLTHGPKWARNAYNALLDFCIRERITNVNKDGAELIRYQSGKLLKVKAPTIIKPRPFHVQPIIDGLKVRVFYGTINGRRSVEMSPGDNPPAIITLNDFDTILWLKVETDMAHNVSNVSIGHGGDSDLPSDDESAGTYYLPLAFVEFDPSSNRVFSLDNLTGSQTFSMCRNWFSNPATYGATWSVI